MQLSLALVLFAPVLARRRPFGDDVLAIDFFAFVAFFAFWGLNRYVQSMGWGGLVNVMAPLSAPVSGSGRCC